MTATLWTIGNQDFDNHLVFSGAEVITPGTNFTYTCRSIYVGTGGDVNIVFKSGDTILHKAVPSGTLIGGFMASQVSATNTTATNMVALFC